MNQIRVNPSRRPGEPYLCILNEVGNQICYRPTGNLVPKKAFYLKLIKSGDLVSVLEPTPIPDRAERKKQKRTSVFDQNNVSPTTEKTVEKLNPEE